MVDKSQSLEPIVSPFASLSPSSPATLLQASDALLCSFRDHLQNSTITMLPSYIHVLPTGSEHGKTLAVDIGGSTLRVAVIQFRPSMVKKLRNTSNVQQRIKILQRRSWFVGSDVKNLRSRLFFDWVVEKIAEVMETTEGIKGQSMTMGVTWSFPIEQTSLASGNVKQMGKGYETWSEIAGTDLRGHFDAALQRRGLRVRMNALMNDTEATLLSHSYTNPATGISLILGTGLNAAVILPITAVSQQKLGTRPKTWLNVARSILVNTEISMFGGDIFPMTTADQTLDRNSGHPGFQPLEQMTSGRYLGEICRLKIIEEVNLGNIFQGVMPGGFDASYSFDTAFMSIFERQPFQSATALLSKIYRFTEAPSESDFQKVRAICLAISERAAIYIAITLFTLWRLQRDSMSLDLSTTQVFAESSEPLAVAYCGAVVEKHLTLRHRCQEVLDLLVELEPESSLRRRLVLEHADDSGLLGAAVGAVMNEMNDMTILAPKL